MVIKIFGYHGNHLPVVVVSIYESMLMFMFCTKNVFELMLNNSMLLYRYEIRITMTRSLRIILITYEFSNVKLCVQLLSLDFTKQIDVFYLFVAFSSMKLIMLK